MAKEYGPPTLRPAKYVKRRKQTSAEWYGQYLETAAEIIEKIERSRYKGTPTLLHRHYAVLSEISNELKLAEAMPEFQQALENYRKYVESEGKTRLDGTATLLRGAIRSIVSRANKFAELDKKVSASAGSMRVMQGVEKLLAKRGQYGEKENYR